MLGIAFLIAMISPLQGKLFCRKGLFVGFTNSFHGAKTRKLSDVYAFLMFEFKAKTCQLPSSRRSR